MDYSAYIAVHLFLTILLALYGMALVYRPIQLVSKPPFRDILYRNLVWFGIAFVAWLISGFFLMGGITYNNFSVSQVYLLLAFLQMLSVSILTMGYPNQFLRDSIFSPSQIQNITRDPWSLKAKDCVLIVVVFVVILICQIISWIVGARGL